MATYNRKKNSSKIQGFVPVFQVLTRDSDKNLIIKLQKLVPQNALQSSTMVGENFEMVKNAPQSSELRTAEACP